MTHPLVNDYPFFYIHQTGESSSRSSNCIITRILQEGYALTFVVSAVGVLQNSYCSSPNYGNLKAHKRQEFVRCNSPSGAFFILLCTDLIVLSDKRHPKVNQGRGP